MGQINIGGANAAVQLKGYTDSSITSDQAFTFPPQAGQLVCYQQGIWTPTTDAGTAPFSNCSWYRIGNSVTVFAKMQKPTSTENNILQIGGTPYASNGESCAAGSAMGRNVELVNGVPFSTVYMNLAGLLNFYSLSNDQYSSLNYVSCGAGCEIYFNATYLTTDATWTPAAGAAVKGTSAFAETKAAQNAAVAAYFAANPSSIEGSL